MPTNWEQLVAELMLSKADPVVVILNFMKEYNFSIKPLLDYLTEEGRDVSFSRVKFSHVAHFVGLLPHGFLRDVNTFELRRSRIPKAVLKGIVTDMDQMMMQYGPPQEHHTEQASSRFIAPIFNHLITLFDFAIRNSPQTLLHGRVTTKGRIEYQFVTFSGFAMLLVEVMLGTGNNEEYYDAIGQVIAECIACDWENSQNGISMPIFGILCNAVTFEFFKFDGNLNPYGFAQGHLNLDRKFPLAPIEVNWFKPFLQRLRLVTEIIFDLMVMAYFSSLTAFRDKLISEQTNTGLSLDSLETAIVFASTAQEHFRNGESNRQAGHIQKANENLSEAVRLLKLSTNAVPIIFKLPSLKDFWIDEDVENM